LKSSITRPRAVAAKCLETEPRFMVDYTTRTHQLHAL
jgi:hypothetical protein